MAKEFEIANIGWTLGNDCPYRCPHCYSRIVRNRGRNLEVRDIDKIVRELVSVEVKTVNLGGNEPIFTGGPDPANTLLPYIIRSLYEAGIIVGLTTAGITLNLLQQFHPDTVPLLNDIDVSLDSPFKEEHNRNRGAHLYHQALDALAVCRHHGIDRSIIMCGMDWNLTDRHLDALVALAREQEAFVRINFMKPTEMGHMGSIPNAADFYRACKRLLSQCRVEEMGEPMTAAMTRLQEKGCPCGIKSFRIHSITPEGRVPVSPCVYAHEYKAGNLLTDSMEEILQSPQFAAFRARNTRPEAVDGCNGCEFLLNCRGGCASRAYLSEQFQGKKRENPLTARDPYCLRDQPNKAGLKTVATWSEEKDSRVLVHEDYICTLILEPNPLESA